jgi:aminoglycoside 6'-N-acetyltransferase I
MEQTAAEPVNDAWHVRSALPDDAGAWAPLRAALWPEAAAADHPIEIARIHERPDRMVAFLAIDAHGSVVGFAEATLRSDCVNGTETSPVGFLEGLYVVPGLRRRGIGRALVAAVERWTRQLGCVELASDALLDNTASHAAHSAYGFDETERVVYFHKRVAP